MQESKKLQNSSNHKMFHESDEVSTSASSGNTIKGGTATEKIAWPPNGGAVAGTEKNVVLTKGYQFD